MMSYKSKIDFGMYSREGNLKVEEIYLWAVLGEKSVGWIWLKLKELGEDKRYEEATDTWVRDRLYTEIAACETGETNYGTKKEIN